MGGGVGVVECGDDRLRVVGHVVVGWCVSAVNQITRELLGRCAISHRCAAFFAPCSIIRGKYRN